MTRKALRQTLAIATRARGNTLPALGMVRLQTHDGMLHFTVTDLETRITAQTPTESDLDCLIPIKEFYTALKWCTDPVSLVQTDSDLEICGGNTRSRISLNDVTQFPDDQSMLTGEDWQSIDADQLRTGLSHVMCAVSPGETRYNLNGVHFDQKAHRLAATDGHRCHTTPFKSHLVGIAPSRTLRALTKSMKRGAIDAACTGRYIGFRNSAVTIIARLIDGEFPSVDRVIPGCDSKTRLTFNRKDLTDALSSVRPDDVTTEVRCVWTDGIFSITSEHSTVGTQGALERDAPKSFAFNKDYFVDALMSFNRCDDVTLYINGPLAPIQFGSSELRHIAVVMPRRIK
jgi:DNA polymerase III sliding clamp (beta) subunit (PCNA family)